MNISVSLTQKEYRYLLDILHLADAVMSGHRHEEDSRSATHRQLIQKLYALAKTSGHEKLIEHDKTGRYVPTHEFEHSTLAHTLIDEFSEHLFWDQLIARMTARDAAQLVGGMDTLKALNERDRTQLESSIRQRYIHEFTTNGISRLEIVERFGATAPGMPVKTSD